ncbi:hypothetical protein RCCGE510_33284, partial [Rhizobium sp. CCGE 510]
SAEPAWDTNVTMCGDPITGHLPWKPDNRFIVEGHETAIAEITQ